MNRSYRQHMLIKEVLDTSPESKWKTHTVLVNPASYSIDYSNGYKDLYVPGATSPSHHFSNITPSVLKIQLLFDSTGSLGVTTLNPVKGIMAQINDFLDIVYRPDKEKKRPRRLQLIWGPMLFEGVASSINIEYTHFDRFGSPIRAKAKCKFMEQNKSKNTKERISQEKKSTGVSSKNEKHFVHTLSQNGRGYDEELKKIPYDQLPNSLRGNISSVFSENDVT